MRRRRNLAAPAVREDILSYRRDLRSRLHPERADIPDHFELRIMAGEPIELPARWLPERPADYGLTPDDMVRVHDDGRIEVIE